VDDRETFERAKRSSAAEMADDPALMKEDLQVLTGSDLYNWSYQWSWLGVPIIQMPPDIVATQEVI
jgi:cephalosporin hydroxylase